MPSFSTLPVEIRNKIYASSIPSATTIKVNEEEYDITFVSPPPALLTLTKESRNAALAWDLKTFPLWTIDDWQDMYLSPKNATLELVIAPSKAASLNITWTEIQVFLGDALKEIEHLHLVCTKPERLVRLFMLPEGGLVRVGQSCVESGTFGKEVVASDRAVRESLKDNILVTISTNTLEELSKDTSKPVEEWRLVDEEVLEGFGPEAKVFLTKSFESNKKEEEEVEEGEVEKEEEEEVEVEKSGVILTEDALQKLVEEIERLFPRSAYESGKEDAGGSIDPELDGF